MFSNPTPSEPCLCPAAMASDSIVSAPTPPLCTLHHTSILQPAIPSHVVAFESWNICAPISLSRVPSWFYFTFAESRKPDLWTYVCNFTSAISVFALPIEMDFSFESLFAIW